MALKFSAFPKRNRLAFEVCTLKQMTFWRRYHNLTEMMRIWIPFRYTGFEKCNLNPQARTGTYFIYRGAVSGSNGCIRFFIRSIWYQPGVGRVLRRRRTIPLLNTTYFPGRKVLDLFSIGWRNGAIPHPLSRCSSHILHHAGVKPQFNLVCIPSCGPAVHFDEPEVGESPEPVVEGGVRQVAFLPE